MDIPGLPHTPPELLALAAALGWASGIRLYAVIFLTGIAGWSGWVQLPPGLQLLEHPVVLGASAIMLLVEFFADKIPLVDSFWDLVQTVLRIPAGALLAAGTLGAEGTAAATVAAILGGTLAATSHTAKMTTRAAVNTSPEPFSNVGVSLLEDGFVVFMLWLSATNPLLFAIALALSVVLAVALVVILYKFLRTVWQELSIFFAGRRPPAQGG